MVQLHNGRIWVNSKENKGSSFYFSLPTATPAAR
jgi:signal transduction histidine kinase